MLVKHNKRAPPTKNRNFSNSGELIMNFLSARFSRTRKEEILPWESNFSTIFCMDIPHNTRKGSGKSRGIPITPRFNLNFSPKRPIFKNGKGGSLVLGIEFFDDFWHGHPSLHKERIWKVSYNSD